MTIKWRRRLALVLLLAVIALALAYGFMPRAVLVDAVRVTRGPFQVTVEQEGKTRVVDRFVISAPVAGFARRIEFDVGDGVSRGQTLVQLDPLRSSVLDPRSRAEAEARVSAAEATLRSAQANARAASADAGLALAEVDRIKRLYSAGSTTREALDRAEAEVRRTAANRRSADFNVEVARFELEAARTTLRYSAAETLPEAAETVALRSPVDGQVLKIERKSEGVANAGQSLIEIGDPRALEVEVDVLSADAVRISPGARVLFERWGGDPPLEGRVRTVEPAGFTKISALGVEEQRVFVVADITSPPAVWARLGDGYRVEARFVLWEAQDILQIPSSALFRYADGWAVFVVQGNRTHRRQVQIGHRSGLNTEITAGLSAGETVIVHPGDAVVEGIRVKLREEG